MKTIDDARPLFAAGKSVNAVAKELVISWYDADKLRKSCEAELAPEVDAEAEGDGGWNLPINIPSNRADDLWAVFTLAEKMEAIRSVIQARMDAMLAPAESEAA